jgi:hypothetical protein
MKRLRMYIILSSGVCASSVLAFDFKVAPSLRNAIIVNIEKKIKEEIAYKELMTDNRNYTRDSYDRYLHNQEIHNSEVRLYQLRQELCNLR